MALQHLRRRVRREPDVLRNRGSLAGVGSRVGVLASRGAHGRSVRDRRRDFLRPRPCPDSHPRFFGAAGLLGLVVAKRKELSAHVRTLDVAAPRRRFGVFRLAEYADRNLPEHGAFTSFRAIARTWIYTNVYCDARRSPAGNRSRARYHDCALARDRAQNFARSTRLNPPVATRGKHSATADGVETHRVAGERRAPTKSTRPTDENPQN